MKGARHVLDASAALAFLRQEPGADVVASHLDGSVMSSVNWSEVVAPYARHGITERELQTLLAALKAEIVPFDAELAIAAARLIVKTSFAGLSLGDRACLALAQARGVPVLTADRAWADVAEAVGVEIVVIR